MKQPELGQKINELRNKKGITQKSLSEFCNIDIRTIQRIESGEVFPRTSTIKLLAEALETDSGELINGNNQNGTDNFENYRVLLLITMIAGMINLVNWFFYAPLFPKFKIFNPYNWVYSIINVVTCLFFYYGFYLIGKYYESRMLKFASFFFMISVPVYFILTIVTSDASQLVLSILGINCLFFGIGLIKTKTNLIALYKITGILDILIAPFFILPIGTLNIIGCWINIPFFILMISIMFLEYKKLKQAN